MLLQLIPNGIKENLANGLITYFVNGNPVFINGTRSLDCIISENWVFDRLMKVDGFLAKAIRRFETWVLVNNNFWRNLAPSLGL